MKIYSMLAGTLVLLATAPEETRAQGVHLPVDPAEYTYNLQKPDSTPNTDPYGFSVKYGNGSRTRARKFMEGCPP